MLERSPFVPSITSVGVRQYTRYMASAVRTVARLESGVHQVMGLQYALACMHVVQDSTDASLAWCCSVSADAQAWGTAENELPKVWHFQLCCHSTGVKKNEDMSQRP